MRDRLFVLLQYLLPRYAMTAVIYRVARIRVPMIKNFLIRAFVRLYQVDLAGVSEAVPDGFGCFNDFFVRALDPAARPIEPEPTAVVAPVDGTVSMAGEISGDRIIQAKGSDYSLTELLAVDKARAAALEGGSFATIYLAPYNYHRVHAPVAGRLEALHYVPGDLFSVNAATVRSIPRLFGRNERLVMHFDTASGPAVVILVGALNVGSITTPWTGEIRPRRRGLAEEIAPGEHIVDLERGDLLGWFNMGSTVIVLLPPGAVEWAPGLAPGKILRMGENIGRRRDRQQ